MVSETDPNDVLIPEAFDEEQKMIDQTCQDFLDAEVFPVLDRIDSQEEGLMPALLSKAGELGLLGVSIAEEYEGFGQSFVTSMIASEIMGSGYSFAVAYSCHTGIGSLPIAYYGNSVQKAKYLPKLASGEWKGAYCLTEPGAGSDANAGKTRATLSSDGQHYILNGQKMWITNAGFADVFTVFAKIDEDRVLSAFIVERSFPGITFNPEEKKMGIKGSSTRQIFFNEVMVPVENLLGGRGQGYRIALNILHMGRLKLGGNVIGAAKMAVQQSVNYANERKQFGMHISSFGSIQHKLAQQVIRTFATESAVYRAAMNVDQVASDYEFECEKEQAMVTAFAQMAIEAAILKVYGSESLDFIVDEAVQIHGGMGFSAEMPVDRGYRDSRINRIFEGTNEINRILVVDTLLKRGQKKEIPLYEMAEEAYHSLKSDDQPDAIPADYFAAKQHRVKNLKKLSLALLHALIQKFDRKWAYEQEILNNLSDIVMHIYAVESVMLRIQKLTRIQGKTNPYHEAILNVLLHDSTGMIAKSARDAIYSFAEGEDLEMLETALNRWIGFEAVNVKEQRRLIANKLIEENKYCF